jgi:GTPase SAR1 family protein
MTTGFDDQLLREIRAGIELARILGDRRFPREATAACLLSGLVGKRIAVLGVVKRGKSTLVNQLIGKTMSPVDMLPETAALLAFQNAGEATPHAVGVSPSGDIVSLPDDADEFRKSVKRGSRASVVAASVSGQFDLPSRVWLLDTPGSSEALVDTTNGLDVGVADCVFRLCQKFLVVIGVPGYSDTDVELVRGVIAKAGKSEVALVVKALDSSITSEALRRVATNGLPNFNITTYTVADGDETAMNEIRKNLGRLSATNSSTTAARAAREVLDAELERLSEITRSQMLASDIDVPKTVYSNVSPALYAIIRDNLPAEKRARDLEAKKRAQAEAEQREKRERKAAQHALESWTAKKRELEAAVKHQQSELNNAQRTFEKNASPVGCFFWFGLGFFGLISLGAFPIGPIVVAVVAFFVYSSAEEDSMKARGALEANLASRRNSLNIASQELNLHLQRKPR